MGHAGGKLSHRCQSLRAPELTFHGYDLGDVLEDHHVTAALPFHVAEDRLGTSAGGRFGDVVEELDWSTGEVLDALERTGVARNTLVVVSSDNGPWFQGSPGGVRGRKFDVLKVPVAPSAADAPTFISDAASSAAAR